MLGLHKTDDIEASPKDATGELQLLTLRYPGSWAQGPISQIPDPGSWIPDAGSGLQEYSKLKCAAEVKADFYKGSGCASELPKK